MMVKHCARSLNSFTKIESAPVGMYLQSYADGQQCDVYSNSQSNTAAKFF